MKEIKYVDIAEWQRLGGLQEANRIFFHPHGWALEVTRVDDTGWGAQNPSGAMSDRVSRVAAALMEVFGVEDEERAIRGAEELLTELYPPGTVYLSGIWDYSDDPEGVVYGSWSEDDIAKAEAVHKKREEHFLARSKLFHPGGPFLRAPQDTGTEDESDIEPFDYTWEDK